MRKMKSLVALVLAGVLCFGMTTFAAESKTTAAYITKDLEVAAGTTTPEATFTFNFAADKANSVGLQGDETPAIEAKTVSYTEAITNEGEDGVITLTTGNVLEGVDFPHAGVYAYTVSEAATGFNSTETETVKYDTKTYTMLVYVVNGTDGPVVDNVIVKGEDEEGTEGKLESLTNNGKSEANGGDESVVDNGEGKANSFRFVNTYEKISGKEDGDGDDENGKVTSITISNATVGDYADKTKEFTYTLNVTKAATDDATEYKYVVVKDGVEEVKTAAFGADVEFTLNDADVVYVKDLGSGATYTVTVNGETDYTTTAVVDGNTTAADEAEDCEVKDVLVSEDGSAADFTNTYADNDVTPTGIIINNLPYVMLITVAAAGLFIVVAGKRREQDI